MAQMHPYPIHPDTRSGAEQKLYRMFQEQLPDDFVVFHSVAWQVRDIRTGAEDGEADFLIAHADFGILVIEVKGGRIRYNGSTDKWFSNQFEIKDPFKQGRHSKYSLLRKLKELRYWRDRRIAMANAAAFPDVSVKQDLRLDAPRELILDASDLLQVQDWVDQALRYARGEARGDEPLGSSGVSELVNLLSPSWDLRPRLSATIPAEQRELGRLTVEQFVMLDFLGRHRRVAIAGCAGSGKTTLAVEKARRLAREGFRVLLTCFNVNLARFLRREGTLPASVDVVNFHKLAEGLVQRAGMSGKGSLDDRYFDVVLPELLMDAVDRLGTQYDAVIVDEGQDFRNDWWIPLECLLHAPDHGILYVFFDDNQNLYRAAQSIPLELAPFPLTRNCRNTQHIHGKVRQFYRSQIVPVAQGPLGRPVEMYVYEDSRGLKRTLRQVLHRLTADEQVEPADIVVLTPKGRDRSTLWRLGRLGNFTLTNQWSPGSGEVFCSTVHSFKGLESPVVILAEIGSFGTQDLESILYVGCSRACNHLIVLASQQLRARVRRKLGLN